MNWKPVNLVCVRQLVPRRVVVRLCSSVFSDSHEIHKVACVSFLCFIIISDESR